MDDKLTWKDKLNITVEAGLQLVPYVGGALATAYYGTKQEKRFKRIESLYREFSEEIEQLKLQLPPVDIHDQDKLISLIEEFNEKVERESTDQKREYFKKYLYSTLSSPTNENFDERRFFLDTLSSMTLLECELLLYIKHQNKPVVVGHIDKIGVDQYAIVGSIGRLRMYGFLKYKSDNFMFNGTDSALLDSFIISDFGTNFIDYCLEKE
ncbi:hypothetical protein CN543_28915 [Bacillus toyonensis]|uniref:hypothetical protein n=1 Tax=Bacillus toyonensis TaxID=155322 RepID=UPI000BEBD394|nr:hypothetical protein [Bacillus toyonensis]PEE79386.1 hypothetical protein COO15_28835 [Bacillus toyonensis]PEN31293.1 hypothetical protein CN543_28915 [Bacillus toyonensis]QWH90240.1 hypothetical protein EXW29_19400 [Bacillus toyonensis]QWI33392.1 hypothetical protein EXW25_19390 [Bacillus toyonensis]